ncbi:hypothetical protein RB653_004777 [Dictyostelium firmibasis]|uniref:RCC1-like domain-containing protein n=1 Tax=Dictyostelium firmibasis TaxID=79012 RepID=A0AAN7YXM0_9MYCE
MVFGALVVFGKNSHGQIGIKIDKEFIYNQDNYTAIPTLLPIFYEVIKVSCGVQHTGFITSTGQVYMFGNGSFGKLGTGDTEDKATPTLIMPNQPIRDIQCGNDHTIALGSGGQVLTWGSASLGRLGHGKTSAMLTPKIVAGLHSISSVYSGGASSGAINKDGHLFTWGYNKYGQLGINNLTDQYTPHRCVFFEIVGVKSFAIGDRHMAAVDLQGELYTWGMNEEYQLGDGSSFNKHLPTMIKVKPFQKFLNVQCGGSYTCAISENGSFWSWGTFVDEYSSSTPKCLVESNNVNEGGFIDFDCSSDCGRHVLARNRLNQVYSFGWNRYGQVARVEEEFIDTVPVSNCSEIIGFPSQVSTGSYHSALLYKNPPDLLAQMLWTGNLTDIENIWSRSNISECTKYRNSNGDSLLHIIAKKGFSHSQLMFMGHDNSSSPNLQVLNKEGLPPYFYNAEILRWPFKSGKSDINFINKPTGDNCLHYFAKKSSIKEFQIAIKAGANHKQRNLQDERPFDLLDKSLAFDIKKENKLYDIGIVYTNEYIHLANRLVCSLEENLITACLINSSQNENRNCYGYIFFVSPISLTQSYQANLLLTFLSKSPMVSIWADKTKITDPTLESCIFRSQLVDFSSYEIYNDSFSILLEGVYNMLTTKENSKGSKSDDDDDDSDIKHDVDTIPHSISGTESIFISFDPNNQKKFMPLFNFFKDNGITIVPREKKVISSWVVVVIISDVEFTPLIRDEISLAENRGKPLIPIYYTDKKLDEASHYTFSNSPKILFNENGFSQLLLLIKLNFKLLHQTEKLIQIKNKIK